MPFGCTGDLEKESRRRQRARQRTSLGMKESGKAVRDVPGDVQERLKDLGVHT